MAGGRSGGNWGRSDRPWNDAERDVRDEIEFHIAMRVRDNVAAGMTPDEARAEAEQRFGIEPAVRRELLKMDTRAAVRERRNEHVGGFVRDVRVAARSLARRSGFTATAMLTLALGIGATTAVFSLANWLLFQPVRGVHAADELATIRFTREDVPVWFPISNEDYRDLRDAAPAVAGFAVARETGAHVAAPDGEPRRMQAALVSGNYASVLGLAPVVGRALGPSDAKDPLVAMISHRLAVRAFGSAAASLGQSLLVNGHSCRVVGVAPRGFLGTEIPGDVDVWMPAEAFTALLPTYGDGVLTDRSNPFWIDAVVRVAPGASLEVAQEQLRAATARVVETSPGSSVKGLQPVFTAGIGLPEFARDQVSELLAILAGVAVFLTLLACANAANLLLTRASGRTDEMAVRRAIGASRWDLVRQLLAEASLIAAGAGGVGLAIAYGAARVFRGEHILSWMPVMGGLEVDGTVLAFTLAMAVGTGLVFGVLPALVSTRNVASSIRSASGGTRRLGPRPWLVVAQVAISLTLLVGAGLLLDTTRALRSTPLGFRPHGVMEASLDPGTQGYGDEDRATLFRDLLERIGALPDVAAVGMSAQPIQGSLRAGYRVRPEGTAGDGERSISALANQVTPGFIDAVGLELVEGRDFRPEETFRTGMSDRVVILSQAAAKWVFPDGSAIGRRVDVGFSRPEIAEVVGVVRDARLGSVKEEGGPLVLDPFGSISWMPSHGTLYARGSGQRTPSLNALKARVAEIDPALPFYDAQPLDRRIAENLTVERMQARVTTLFAVLALVLTTIGLYGVLAMVVQARAREFGVRLVLGADPVAVRTLVVRQGLRTTVVGVVLGFLLASQAVRLIANRLWGVRAFDPFVFGVALVTMLLATLCACWIPARRATRLDPIEILRTE